MAKKTRISASSVSFGFLFIVGLSIAICDLVYLNFRVLDMQKRIFYLEGNSPKGSLPANTSKDLSNTNTACPAACDTKINDVRTGLETKISAIPQGQTIVQSGGGGSNAKEFFISFGSGSSSSSSWEDVQGLQAYVDKASYPSIKSVVFEASMIIPTGNETAYVRLYNVTDKHPVWNSELSLDGGTGKLLTSPKITLDSGKKLYQVQMKTSLKYPATLNQARLHITVK